GRVRTGRTDRLAAREDARRDAAARVRPAARPSRGAVGLPGAARARDGRGRRVRHAAGGAGDPRPAARRDPARGIEALRTWVSRPYEVLRCRSETIQKIPAIPESHANPDPNRPAARG